jgi:hypothetical protein
MIMCHHMVYYDRSVCTTKLSTVTQLVCTTKSYGCASSRARTCPSRASALTTTSAASRIMRPRYGTFYHRFTIYRQVVYISISTKSATTKPFTMY